MFAKGLSLWNIGDLNPSFSVSSTPKICFCLFRLFEFIPYAFLKFRRDWATFISFYRFLSLPLQICTSFLIFKSSTHPIFMLLSLLHLKSSHCSSNIVPFHVIQFYRGFQDTIPALDSYFLFSVDSSGFTPWITVSSRFILWLHAYAFSIKASNRKKKGGNLPKL